MSDALELAPPQRAPVLRTRPSGQSSGEGAEQSLALFMFPFEDGAEQSFMFPVVFPFEDGAEQSFAFFPIPFEDGAEQ